ncbi:MAG: 30S ribosomal protein S18 [Myxococcota bacterium]
MVELIVKRPQGRKRRRSGGRRMFTRQKVCRFCADSQLVIDYKDARVLRTFVTERHKIIPRRISGNCARHQRALTVAIKRARHIALMPFTTQHV